MIQRLAGWLLEGAAGALEDSIPEGTLRSFLMGDLSRLLDRAGSQGEWPAWAHDLVWAERLLVEAGLAEAKSRRPPSPATWPEQEPLELDRWVEGLQDSRLIEGGRVPWGTAAALAKVLAGEGSDAAQEALRERWLPSLLRHVELKRREALRLRPEGRPLETWLERDGIAILFARAARTWGDMRYLNAAMKLNDWGFRVHRRAVPVNLRARYLLALAEQEALIERWKL